MANWSCEPLCGHPSLGDRDRLYHNNGDGTFDDVIGLLEGGGSTTGAGFVATWVDYDNDGDPDIYLVNDEFINPVGNMLWRNDGPGCEGWCFTQAPRRPGPTPMSWAWAWARQTMTTTGILTSIFPTWG